MRHLLKAEPNKQKVSDEFDREVTIWELTFFDDKTGMIIKLFPKELSGGSKQPEPIEEKPMTKTETTNEENL